MYPSPASPSPPSPSSPESSPVLTVEEQEQKRIQELYQQLAVCTDTNDWEKAEEIMIKLRSQELRQARIVVRTRNRKERMEPTNVATMCKKEAQIIKSLAKLRSDMQMVKRGSSSKLRYYVLQCALCFVLTPLF
jgi:hypothetical protein